MKIVVVNYRYFVSGGPERYMFNIIDLLQKEGHEVIPFSIVNARNSDTPYSSYFLPAIGRGDEVYFAEMESKLTLRDKVKGLGRMIYSFEAKRCFKRLLRDVKPDLVYILYYQNKISCSVVDAAYEMGIPVVQRISDYSLIAPCSHLFDLHSNTICERCLKEGATAAIKQKCVMDSAIYSAVKACAIKTQDLRKMPRKISRFIFPSGFTMKKFVERGYDPDKLVLLPTLFNDRILDSNLEINYKPYALFIGRTDPDKGLMTLLDAFIGTDHNLKIIGFSSEPGYQEKLKAHLEGKRHNIEFLGGMEFDKLQKYVAECLFTVVPSEWYDNLPNTILESYAMSKCVVATNIGSLSENISDGETGLLFRYKDTDHLRSKIDYLFNNPDKAKEYGKNGRRLIETKYNHLQHVKALTGVFEEVLSQHAEKKGAKIN